MIIQMKKVLLAGKNSEREKLLLLLKDSAMLHVDPIETSVPKSSEELANEISDCEGAIAYLDNIQLNEEDDKIASPGTPKRIIQQVFDSRSKLQALESTVRDLTLERNNAVPWGDLGSDYIKELKSKGINFYFFKGAIGAADKIDADAVMTVSPRPYPALYVAASRREINFDKEAVFMVDPPRASYLDIDDELQIAKNEISHQHSILRALALRKKDLKSHLTKLTNKKKLVDVNAGLFEEEAFFILMGWLPDNKVQQLQEIFTSANMKVGLDFYDPEDDELPPTLIKTSKFGEAVMPLYNFMGMVPGYREPDVSEHFLLSLAIFSGFIIADAGYGLLMFLPILFSYGPLKKRGVDPNILNLWFVISASMSIYGVLTNAYFGVVAPFSFYQFVPEDYQIQGVCFLLGAIHITIAHIIKLKNEKFTIKHFAEYGWILLIWAFYILICQMLMGRTFLLGWSLFYPLLTVALTLTFLFTEPSKNLFKMFGSGLATIALNAGSYFSDILSFIRLWAVGLAGGKMAESFNILAAMIPILPGRIIIYFIGHTLNICLSLISVLAHGVRLNILEFSNHLGVEWAGRKYKPFQEIK